MKKTQLKRNAIKTLILLLILFQPVIFTQPRRAVFASGSATGAGLGLATAGPQTPETKSPFSANTDAGAPEEGAEPVPPELSCDSAVLMDAATGIVLYSKEMYKQAYPASVTKVLTALLALEKGGNDLKSRIHFSYEAVHSIEYGSSHIAMNEGDTLALDDALYGLLLASANEVANAIAEHFGGSAGRFAGMMNERAARLGAENSHFTNASGLHDPDHYSCAYDMALCMREAIKQPFFIRVISTLSHDIPATESEPLGHPLYNQNKLVAPGKYHRDDVVGGKTGFTNEAGNTLATYAAKDGIGLVAVVMNATSMGHYADTHALLDYGFASYHDVKVLDAAEYTGSVGLPKSAGDGGSALSLSVRVEDDVRGIFPLGVNTDTVALAPRIRQELSVPVEEGDEVGVLAVMYNDLEIGSVRLFAGEGLRSEQAPPSEAPEASAVFAQANSGGDGGESPAGVGNLILRVLKWALISFAALVLGLVIAAVFMRRARRRRRRMAYALRYSPGMRPRPRRLRQVRASEWSARRYR